MFIASFDSADKRPNIKILNDRLKEGILNETTKNDNNKISGYGSGIY